VSTGALGPSHGCELSRRSDIRAAFYFTASGVVLRHVRAGLRCALSSVPVEMSVPSSSGPGTWSASGKAHVAVRFSETPEDPLAPTVVLVAGEVDIETSPELQQAIFGAWVAGHAPIAVDLSQVTFIASAGVSALLMAARPIREDGGEVWIRHPSPPVRRLFEVLGADIALDIEG
jgi:anti-anti-sigma factor